MKKLKVSIVVACLMAAFMFVGSAAAWQGNGNGMNENFVDEDGDGVCDVAGTGLSQNMAAWSETTEGLAVGGDGWLYAEGRGKALIEGTGIAAFSGIGRLVVIGKDIDVMTEGDGRVIKLGYLVTIYRGNGVAVFEGEDMTIFARGKGRLAAKGEGMAIIRGAGDWSIGEFATWDNTEVEPYDEPYEVEGLENKSMNMNGQTHQRKIASGGIFGI